jgi:MFS family permease
MTTSLIAVSWTSWMSDLVPPSLRGRYFGRRNFICNSVGALTAVAAGQFISKVGGEALWSFGVAIVVGMLSRMISAMLLAQQPEPEPEKLGPGRLRDHLAAPLASRQFRRYAQFGMAWGFAVHVSSPFFAVYMIRDLGIDFGVVTLMAALSIVTNLLGQRFWGPVSDRYSHLQVMQITVIVVVLQPVWWVFASDSGIGFVLIVFAHLLGGFTWGGYQLASGNLMMALAPETGKSSFFAAQAALSGVAGAVGPIAGGILADGFLTQIEIPYLTEVSSLPTLFMLSFVLRFASWGLLQRIREPKPRPRLRIAYLIADALRGSNSTQGFDPLLHRAYVSTDDALGMGEAAGDFSSNRDVPDAPRSR